MNNGGSPLNDIDIDMDISSDRPVYSAGNAYAVAVRALSVNVGGAGEVLSGFRDVRLAGIYRRLGVWINCSPSRAFVENVRNVEAPVTGIWWSGMSNPLFTNNLIRSRGNYVHGAGLAGIRYALASAASGRIEIDGDEAVNCNQTETGTSTTGVSIFCQNALTMIYRNAIVGDSTSKQLSRDAIHSIGTLIEENIIDIGAVPALSRGTITSHIFHGRGAGAPTFAAANGSTYIRTDGGAASTFYVREAGSWVAK